MTVQDYVILQGKQVPYEIARIPVDAVTLDPRNPRIEYLLGQKFGGMASQADIVEALWDKDQVKALGQSIFANGGVREHIIVQRGKDGGYLVREGNCRTASSKKLREANPGDNRFDSIPAHIFDSTLTEEDVASLIADVHVAKKISWDAYTQAKTIHELSRVHGKTYEWLVNHLRLSRSKVSEYLAAYDAMSAFLQVTATRSSSAASRSSTRWCARRGSRSSTTTTWTGSGRSTSAGWPTGRSTIPATSGAWSRSCGTPMR